MFSVKKAAATAVVGGTLAASFIGTTAAQAKPAGSTYEGCKYGYVCIYPENKGWNGGHPSNTYYTYGAHNLSNQLGHHYVFNNQSGGASVTLTRVTTARTQCSTSTRSASPTTT